MICTVALGPKYVAVAAPLFAALARAGNRCLVLTDAAPAFPECSALAPVDDGTHVWYAKRHVLRAGLERDSTAYWVEADSVLGAGAIPVFGALPPGLWGRFTAKAAWLRGAPARRQTLLAACERFSVEPEAIVVGPDSSFAVSRDDGGAWLKFFDVLDEYAGWLRDANLLTSDDLGMGIAAHLAGWKPQVERAVFLQLAATCRHLRLGEWRKGLPGGETT
jgi:hypothetical protein